MNIPTIPLTDDWRRFFREHGQFIQPLDKIYDSEKLKIFEQWGQGVWDHFEQLTKDFQIEVEEAADDRTKSAQALKNLKHEINQALRSELGDETVLKKIGELCA